MMHSTSISWTNELVKLLIDTRVICYLIELTTLSHDHAPRYLCSLCTARPRMDSESESGVRMDHAILEGSEVGGTSDGAVTRERLQPVQADGPKDTLSKNK